RDRFRAQHEAPIAIAAFDEILVAHFEIDLGMAKRAAASVTGDTRAVHDNDFWWFDAHSSSGYRQEAGIIAGEARIATPSENGPFAVNREGEQPPTTRHR